MELISYQGRIHHSMQGMNIKIPCIQQVHTEKMASVCFSLLCHMAWCPYNTSESFYAIGLYEMGSSAGRWMDTTAAYAIRVCIMGRWHAQVQLTSAWGNIEADGFSTTYIYRLVHKIHPWHCLMFPLRSRHFLYQKLWSFHKNTHSCVENECCCPCTANILNVNFT